MKEVTGVTWTAIEPSEVPMRTLYQYLVGIVAPRPIAFVSSINAKGALNLSPFSFFNVFSIDPPIMVFSPTRKGRDLSKKDTRINVDEIPEVVIHMVDKGIAEQMSITSAEYPYEVNEFEKAGFETIPSDIVRPPRIANALVAMECLVDEIKDMGDIAGSGCLVICRLLKLHIRTDLLDQDNNLELMHLNQLGRMGGNIYCEAFGTSLFEMPRPLGIGLGIDQLPVKIRSSKFLTGNDLGKLGKLIAFPSNEKIEEIKIHKAVANILSARWDSPDAREESFCNLAKSFLDDGDAISAMSVLTLL